MKILFVCLGNICRSPTAEALFRYHLAKSPFSDRILHDSAGTGGWHQGEGADPRTVAMAARFGVDMSDLRARKIKREDFDFYDLILGMDRQNVQDLMALKPEGSSAKVALYLEAALGRKDPVPDPYYGGSREFEQVYRLCDEASKALVDKIVDNY